jgi:hypothetical protein
MQMQDIRQAAHKKSRHAKSTKPDDVKKNNETASAPASSVQ